MLVNSVKSSEYQTLFRSYSRNISTLKTINETNEDLVKLYKKGDKLALSKLVEKNIKLIIKIASKFCIYGDIFIDLINEGILAIKSAATNYNMKKNSKFSSYASLWIRHYMSYMLEKYTYNGIKNNRTINILKKINRKISQGKDINSALEEVNLTIEEFKKITSISKVIHFSDLSPSENCNFGILPKIASDNNLYEEIEKRNIMDILYTCLDMLEPKERFILEKRFGLNGKKEMSLREVGQIFKTSPENIRYIERRAIIKLRNTIKDYI